MAISGLSCDPQNRHNCTHWAALSAVFRPAFQIRTARPPRLPPQLQFEPEQFFTLLLHRSRVLYQCDEILPVPRAEHHLKSGGSPVFARWLLLALLASCLCTVAAYADAPLAGLITWGSTGSAPGQFDAPYGITTDAAGFVYVVDTANNCVQKFNAQGQFLLQWESTGSAPGQFSTPISIVASPNSHIYVGDQANHRKRC